MLHFIPLPGYHGFSNIEEVRQAALYDLEAIIVGGVDRIILENNDDLPHRAQVGPKTFASLATLAFEKKQPTKLSLGFGVP